MAVAPLPRMPQKATRCPYRRLTPIIILESGQLVPAHFCSEHSQEFKKRTGQYGEFWSHQIKGTRNQWCNEAKK
jgi:hypothetical protein